MSSYFKKLAEQHIILFMGISLYPASYCIVGHSVSKKSEKMSDIFMTSPEKKDRPVAGRRAVRSASPAQDTDVPVGAAATGEFMNLISLRRDDVISIINIVNPGHVDRHFV
jgi:hypothetical protein